MKDLPLLKVDSGIPDELKGIAIKDESNPRSIINLVPSSMANQIKVIPDAIFSWGEGELKTHTKIDVLEERLRLAFWREYDAAQIQGRKINLSHVYGGVCTQAVFQQKVVANSFKLAYILTPPLDYEIQMKELLQLGLEQLRDILLLPHLDEKGRPNPKMADVKQKIVESLHLRVKGAVPYRMETKNLNVNVDETKPRWNQKPTPTSPEEIERRLKELQQAVDGGEVINVQPIEVEES